jgi:septin family protein
METVVKPKRVKEWEVDQSKHEHLPSVPFRMIIAGPSGTGKSQLIQSMILDFYQDSWGKSVFARVYIWSPSVFADPVWEPVRRFLRERAPSRPVEGEVHVRQPTGPRS